MNRILRSVALMLGLLIAHASWIEAGYLFGLLEDGESQELVECICRLTKAGRTEWRTMRDKHGSPLLHTAVFLEDAQAIEALARNGAHLDEADHVQMTPLHIAARDRRLPIMRYLIRLGVELDYHDIDGYTPLHYAVLKDEDLADRDDRESVKATKLLVQAGAFLDAANDDGSTPLHLAVDSDNIALVSILLAAGANPNVLNNADRTPLDLAIQNSNEMAVRLLVLHGAYTDKPDMDGDTPLHNAVVSGGEELVRYFVEEVGARLNVKNHVGETPLDAAVTLKNSRLVGYLMAHGASSSELPLRWLDLAVSRKQQKKAEDSSVLPTVLGTRRRELSKSSCGDQRAPKRSRFR